jgi:DNA-directed RNA polymerase subunit beta
LKKVVGRKLAARVLNTWVEDFVDEDTGEVVSIERNEMFSIVIQYLRKSILKKFLKQDVKPFLLHKESATAR